MGRVQSTTLCIGRPPGGKLVDRSKQEQSLLRYKEAEAPIRENRMSEHDDEGPEPKHVMPITASIMGACIHSTGGDTATADLARPHIDMAFDHPGAVAQRNRGLAIVVARERMLAKAAATRYRC
ncbi:MAG TPA: hypothetical protein VIL60_11260 [Rhodanobacter sp.]